MKRFKDFAKEQALDGDKIRLDDILDHEILVIAHQITGSKYSDNGKICLKLQFELQGERHILFTGSTVLARQAEEYKDEMPFLATIKKVDNYYTFS